MQMARALDAFTSLGATWVLWLLGCLSVVGLAVIVERTLYLALRGDDVVRLGRELRELLARGDPQRARRRLEESPSFEASIAAAALDALSADDAEQRMIAASQRSRLSMERWLAILGTLGNNAPFVGLLGTVIGIVRAFRALESGAGQVSAGLMAEVGEALIATAVGLLVALPAVAAFNAFQRVIRTRIGGGEVLGREVLAYWKRRAAEA
jgi:biopolymer transport protein ExbB